MSEHFYHNGTGSQNLRPCELVSYLPREGVATIRPAGWAKGKHLKLSWHLVFHKLEPILAWSRATSKLKSRPSLPKEFLTKLEELNDG